MPQKHNRVNPIVHDYCMKAHSSADQGIDHIQTDFRELGPDFTWLPSLPRVPVEGDQKPSEGVCKGPIHHAVGLRLGDNAPLVDRPPCVRQIGQEEAGAHLEMGS